jgi:glycine cleavage system H protein
MTQIPDEVRCTKEHEWVRIEERKATIGLTDHAQNELTDIIFVELPEVGKEVKKGDVIGAVESVKSVAEIFSPVSGRIADVNQELGNSPDMINKDPYGNGWIAVLEMDDPSEADDLLSPEDYAKLLEK